MVFETIDEQKDQVEQYLETKRIRNMLHNITKLLILKKPEDPVKFLADVFLKAQESGLHTGDECFNLEHFVSDSSQECPYCLNSEIKVRKTPLRVNDENDSIE
ncbi:MAG: hypothetical protein MHPSP_000182 [Paramarteilia canceri]